MVDPTAMVPPHLTLGERTGNPGNLRRTSTPWHGLIPLDKATQTVFCEFESDLMGVRAMARVILNAYRLDECRTLTQLVAHYAPPNENDTGAYADDVSERTGIRPGAFIDPTHPGELANLVRAFIYHENGRCLVSTGLIKQAVALALNLKPGASST